MECYSPESEVRHSGVVKRSDIKKRPKCGCNVIGQVLTADIVTGPPVLQLQLDWELKPDKRILDWNRPLTVDTSIVDCYMHSTDVYSSIGYE